MAEEESPPLPPMNIPLTESVTLVIFWRSIRICVQCRQAALMSAGQGRAAASVEVDFTQNSSPFTQNS